MAALGDEKFVLFTTFKKDGQPVATPVWIAGLGGGRLGFTTSSGTWKVKRLRRNNAVRLQPCSRTGTPEPGSTVTDGTAEVFGDGPRVAEVRSAIRAKYGFQVTVIHAVQTLLGRLRARRGGTQFTNDSVVVIELGAAAAAG